ncbi:MAG: hypothetical protein AAFV26_07730 [Pseudomonadota bacterium]
MAFVVQVSGFVLAGVFIGLIGSLFDPAALGFRAISVDAVRAFPYAAFVPGLMLGMVFGAAMTLNWDLIRKRLWFWLTQFGRLTDLAVIAGIAVVVLFFV